jgi:serine/threonine protein kinase
LLHGINQKKPQKK